MATVDSDPDLALLEIGPDYVVALREDPNGVQFVGVYDLVRPHE